MSSSDNPPFPPTGIPLHCEEQGETDEPTAPTPRRTQTRWSLVRRAQGEGPQARRALGELLSLFAPGLSVLIKRFPRPFAYSVEDLRQEFFAYAIDCDLIRRADEGRGSFAGFLYCCAARFMLKKKEFWNAACRRELDTLPLPFEAGYPVVPDLEYDAAIAWAMQDEMMRVHRAEHAADIEFFDRISRFLPHPDMNLKDQGRVAAELGWSASKLSLKLGKLRARHDGILRAVVADSLDVDPEDPASTPIIDVELSRHYRALRFKEYLPDPEVHLDPPEDD